MTSPRSRQSGRVRILLLGAADVGKTAFVVRLLTKRFIGEYDQNKETLYTHRLITADSDVFLEILDSANNADDSQMEANVRWADGFLLLFSVTDPSSFRRLDVYLAQILQLRRTQLNAVDDPTSPGGGVAGPALVLAANKTDCPPHARRVTPDEARGLAARVERPLFELSVADSPEGVQRAIEDVVRQVRQREQQQQLQQQQASGGSRAGGRLTQGTFTNVKRVLKEKIYKGSRSDTWMSTGLEKLGK